MESRKLSRSLGCSSSHASLTFQPTYIICTNTLFSRSGQGSGLSRFELHTMIQSWSFLSHADKLSHVDKLSVLLLLNLHYRQSLCVTDKVQVSKVCL